MTTIASLALPAAVSPAELWLGVASATCDWLDEHGLQTADAVLLLPFAELIMPARRAFARQARWMPRIHTTRTLAAALGPPVARAAGELTGHATIDRVAARELMRGQAWGAQWSARDPHGFEAAVQRVVHTAHGLQRHAAALPPVQRAAWWARAREQTAAGSGPGALHRALLRLAAEWAAQTPAADTDRLFAYRPAAWIALAIGGDDPLAQGLLSDAAEHGVPTLMLQADPSAEDPFEAWPERCDLTLEAADDAEAEAMAAAARVAHHVRSGATPVALVVQDRALVRRVRALLERLQLDVVDETGWSLATTRAGAHAMAALRAARGGEASDDALDWLKADLDDAQTELIAALEKAWRGQRMVEADRVAADALWQRERARLQAFARPRRRPLGAWLVAFDALLFGSPHGAARRDDPAGVQLRRALHLGDAGRLEGAAWLAVLAAPHGLDEFIRWVEAALEEASFVPPPPARAATVVITPLSRAGGREFGAAVLPGADELRLGPLPHEPGLLDEPARRLLGLPQRAQRQRRAALAFLQLLRVPRVAVLWRRAEGDELLTLSPWLERLALARHQRGRALPMQQAAPVLRREVPAAPVLPPRPSVAAGLPASWSASQVDALRQCPYRFFSRAVLKLSEADELDDEADKRDAGRWLHATLERFHLGRDSPRDAAADTAALVAVGHDTLARMEREHSVSAEAMLPFTAAWPSLAARYVQWLHGQEADGWSFTAAEQHIDMPATAQGLRLHGRVDRIDTLAGGGAVRLIDYKIQSPDKLRRKVREPLEDSQLAVYAALQASREAADRRVRASYVALDDDRGVAEIEHTDVAATAQRLVRELARERQRIEAGAPLRALGESPVCDTCEARGLCRRDHWSVPERQAPDAG